MNETEENKVPEHADKPHADQPKADEAKVEQPRVDQTKAEQAEDNADSAAPGSDSAAPGSDSAVTEPEAAVTEEATPAVEEPAVEEPAVEEKEAKPAAKPKAKDAKPVRTKQPTPEDKLNINEDLPWYVVQAFSGYEASVKRSLIERIERAGLGADFGEILVPTEEVVEIRGGQKRKSERKFFPGYVLVQINLTDESWHLVKDVPRVLGFIGGTADRPAPITAKEADAILQRVQDGVDKPRPKVLFDVGEVVRVTDGPFNDFNGVVEEVNFEKNKLLVAVQIFGRSTPVELEFSQVEKA